MSEEEQFLIHEIEEVLDIKLNIVIEPSTSKQYKGFFHIVTENGKRVFPEFGEVAIDFAYGDLQNILFFLKGIKNWI